MKKRGKERAWYHHSYQYYTILGQTSAEFHLSLIFDCLYCGKFQVLQWTSSWLEQGHVLTHYNGDVVITTSLHYTLLCVELCQDLVKGILLLYPVIITTPLSPQPCRSKNNEAVIVKSKVNTHKIGVVYCMAYTALTLGSG